MSASKQMSASNKSRPKMEDMPDATLEELLGSKEIRGDERRQLREEQKRRAEERREKAHQESMRKWREGREETWWQKQERLEREQEQREQERRARINTRRQQLATLSDTELDELNCTTTDPVEPDRHSQGEQTPRTTRHQARADAFCGDDRRRIVELGCGQELHRCVVGGVSQGIVRASQRIAEACRSADPEAVTPPPNEHCRPGASPTDSKTKTGAVRGSGSSFGEVQS
jgi:hypothetical protein